MDSLGWLDPISFGAIRTDFRGHPVSCREGNTHNTLQAHTSLNELVMLNNVCLWTSICHSWHMEISQKKTMDGTTQDSWKSSCPALGWQLTGKNRLAYQHLQGNVLRNRNKREVRNFPKVSQTKRKTLLSLTCNLNFPKFLQVSPNFSKPEIINHLLHLKARPRHIIDLVHCDRLDATHPDMLRSRW